MNVCLLIGFDTEAPFDQPYAPEGLTKAVWGSLKMVSGLNELLNSFGVSRTFFLLGRFLIASLKVLAESELREVLECSNPLVDLQSHGFAHRQFRPMPTIPVKTALTPAEVYEDVLAASDVLESVLGVAPLGLRAPRGYALGLQHETELLENLRRCKISYVSSDLRDRNWQICTSLFDEGELRQPYQYPNGLWEIPSHGWQDTAFSGLSLKGVPDFAGMGKSALDNYIISHYKSLIDEACSVSEQLKRTIYLGACLHPQAIQVYDPDLKLLGGVLDYARRSGAKVCSYTAAYKELQAEES